jgi:hypothetical protein
VLNECRTRRRTQEVGFIREVEDDPLAQAERIDNQFLIALLACFRRGIAIRDGDRIVVSNCAARDRCRGEDQRRIAPTREGDIARLLVEQTGDDGLEDIARMSMHFVDWCHPRQRSHRASEPNRVEVNRFASPHRGV